MPPRRDQVQEGGDSHGVLAQLTENLHALEADNEEIMARNEEIEARMTAIESRPNPQSVHQASVEPPDGIITQQTTVTPLSEDKRWRPEEFISLDGTGDMHVFTDRFTSVAELKTPKSIQNNQVTVLKGVARSWFLYELSDITRWSLNSNTSVSRRGQTLIERFGTSHSDLISQLKDATTLSAMQPVGGMLLRISKLC